MGGLSIDLIIVMIDLKCVIDENKIETANKLTYSLNDN